MKYLYLYLIIINAAGFVSMLVDKQKAKIGAWRTPERVLMTIAAIGGSLGSYLGMQLFRHKTKHPKFYIGIPVLLAVHVWLLVVLHQ
jgi:uncharacterized membrane protein YsdA (DUF1294 family)